MFGIFAQRYVKEGKLFLKNARKFLHYKRDLWSGAAVADFEQHMQKLEKALRDGDKRGVEEAAQQLDTMVGSYSPPAKDAAWRENCEVFLVAIVIAVGIRTYFLQPFTIPTGSMQPTLNGIIGSPTAEELPNFFVRALDFVWCGRNYINVVAKRDDQVKWVREIWRGVTFTQLSMESGDTYTIYCPLRTLEETFRVVPGQTYHKGDTIARGHIDAGDHVFVDKFTYNFRAPRRGEVFVFNTKGIPTQENRGHPDALSQFYIKRLAGTPGDTLRIDPPNLFINGEMAKEPGFRRVMAAQDGYHGYCNMPPGAMFRFLTTPDNPLQLPPEKYFALGDNSYHSSDGRDWGFVPQQNIMGRGLFVYLPFAPHFGLIK